VRVLSVTHGPTVGGGVFNALVEDSGHTLERWRVPIGGSPHPPARYDAVLVFGGAMHPDQDEHFPWLTREAEFLGTVLAEGVPALGVCLGAQLLARAAGAAVRPARAPEIGWHSVELTDEGRADPVLHVLPAQTEAFQWHHYTFDIPGGGTELAVSEVCTQAFRTGNAWGIQFHAEVTMQMVEAWAADDGHELPGTVEEFLEVTRSRIETWNDHGRRICGAFLEAAASA
jgi:GMP synthase-like glutamine amidotransferase